MSRCQSEPSLRPARPEDAAALRACARAAYSLYLPRMDRPPAPMLADYEALVDAGEVAVLEAGGGLLGFIVCRLLDDCLFVENLGLWPEQQGRGFGRRMMDWADGRALAAGRPAIRLYTNAAMTENVGFYERLGFTVEDRRLEDGYHRLYFVRYLER